MDNWGTPDWLMDVFIDWFDPCPFNPNPIVDGLTLDWKDKTYVNPPYSNPLKWVEKAIEENKKGKTIAMLLKHDSSTRWYAKLVEAKAHFFLLSGRLKFKGKNYNEGTGKLSPVNFPSIIVILSKHDVENTKNALKEITEDMLKDHEKRFEHYRMNGLVDWWTKREQEAVRQVAKGEAQSE